jgi:uncharacterized HAD superfamily protein
MKACWYDMDGSLSRCGHRLHYIATKPRNFDAFEAECHKDPINEPVAETLKALQAAGYKILIVTARMDGRKQLTVDWLAKHNIPYDALYMRKQDDTRKDDIIKKELLDKIKEDGYDLKMAFDDRKRVKRMLIENDIFVFDLNQKDLEY